MCVCVSMSHLELFAISRFRSSYIFIKFQQVVFQNSLAVVTFPQWMSMMSCGGASWGLPRHHGLGMRRCR